MRRSPTASTPLAVPRRRLLSALTGLTGLLIGAVPLAAAEAAPSLWQRYKQRFLTSQGRILDTGNGNISHSEGQGYAMVLAVAWNDRTAFDTLWHWTQASLRRPEDGLFSWRYEAGSGITDVNNASDGDVLIAWALERAFQRWGDRRYAQQSSLVRAAISQHLIRTWRGHNVLLPGLQGFTHDDDIVVNLSYWVFPAFQEFATREPGSGVWTALIQSGLRLLEEAKFGARQLPPDWLSLPRAATPPPVPAPEFDPVFGFNAVRIPLYLYWGGAPLFAALNDSAICRFWTQGRSLPPATVNLQTGATAAYPISRGVQAVRTVSCGGTGLPKPDPADEDYYSATLGLLSLLAYREHVA